MACFYVTNTSSYKPEGYIANDTFSETFTMYTNLT